MCRGLLRPLQVFTRLRKAFLHTCLAVSFLSILKRITVTDGIKVVTKLTLRYLGGPDVVTKVFISARGRQKRKNKRMVA